MMKASMFVVTMSFMVHGQTTHTNARSVSSDCTDSLPKNRYTYDMKFVIPGAHPLLAAAELQALADTPSIKHITKQVVVIESALPAPYFVERTGSIVKAGSVVDTLTRWDEQRAIELLSGYLSSDPEGRPIFGVSVYDAGNYKIATTISKSRDRIGLGIKRHLKAHGLASRYASSKDIALSSVFVSTNNLIENGADICLIAHEAGVMIGITEAVQDFRAWSDRDFGRPARDTGSGMLPPKLARTLVNLSGAQEQQTLLDPFCGSATVLMEAMLMGMHHIIGSDISPKAIKDSEKNLRWLIEHKWVSQPLPTLMVTSAEHLSEHLHSPVDVVAGETYLGPPQSGKETRERRVAVQKDLLEKYKPMFTGLRAVMKPNAKAVIAFPAFKVGTGHEFLPLRSLLQSIGFEILNPLPPNIPATLGTLTPNNGLLYERENQKTARDIIVMKRT